eukprot:COSAG02_NODE_31005_length_541_cov_0.728507_2_plen_132_part_01
MRPRSPTLADGSEMPQRSDRVLERRPVSSAARRIQRSAAIRAEREKQNQARAINHADGDATATSSSEAPDPEQEPVHVFPAGAVRVPKGREHDDRTAGWPHIPDPRFRAFSPLFPSESFVFKQPELQPHNNG